MNKLLQDIRLTKEYMPQSHIMLLSILLCIVVAFPEWISVSSSVRSSGSIMGIDMSGASGGFSSSYSGISFGAVYFALAALIGGYIAFLKDQKYYWIAGLVCVADVIYIVNSFESQSVSSTAGYSYGDHAMGSATSSTNFVATGAPYMFAVFSAIFAATPLSANQKIRDHISKKMSDLIIPELKNLKLSTYISFGVIGLLGFALEQDSLFVSFFIVPLAILLFNWLFMLIFAMFVKKLEYYFIGYLVVCLLILLFGDEFSGLLIPILMIGSFSITTFIFLFREGKINVPEQLATAVETAKANYGTESSNKAKDGATGIDNSSNPNPSKSDTEELS